jgi:hypothetical protein
MGFFDITLAILAFILTAYLLVRRWRLAQGMQERQWAGHGIDLSSVAPSIEQLRRDYVAELHSRPTSRRKEWLMSARRDIASKSYFRRSRPGDVAECETTDVRDA